MKKRTDLPSPKVFSIRCTALEWQSYQALAKRREAKSVGHMVRDGLNKLCESACLCDPQGGGPICIWHLNLRAAKDLQAQVASI